MCILLAVRCWCKQCSNHLPGFGTDIVVLICQRQQKWLAPEIILLTCFLQDIITLSTWIRRTSQTAQHMASRKVFLKGAMKKAIIVASTQYKNPASYTHAFEKRGCILMCLLFWYLFDIRNRSANGSEHILFGGKAVFCCLHLVGNRTQTLHSLLFGNLRQAALGIAVLKQHFRQQGVEFNAPTGEFNAILLHDRQ